MNVYQKLNLAREKFHSAEIKKSGHNKFAGYHYFELGDFLPAVQQIFHNLKLLGFVSYSTEVASLRIVNAEDPTDFMVIETPMASAALKGAHDIQNLGAVQTYLRRYLWVTAMEIVEHDELDATLGSEKKLSGKDRLREAISQHGVDLTGIETILTLAKSKTVDQIPDKTAAALADAITPAVAKLYNEGKNSKGQQILPASALAPAEEQQSAKTQTRTRSKATVPTIDELSAKVAEAFEGEEIED